MLNKCDLQYQKLAIFCGLPKFCQCSNKPKCCLGGFQILRKQTLWQNLPWPERLYCVLGQDTLLSQCLSPPRCINEYRQTLMLGGSPAMDQHPIRGEQKYSQSLHAAETGISSGLMGHLAQIQTSSFLTIKPGREGGYCYILVLQVCAAVKGMVFKQFTLAQGI